MESTHLNSLNEDGIENIYGLSIVIYVYKIQSPCYNCTWRYKWFCDFVNIK